MLSYVLTRAGGAGLLREERSLLRTTSAFPAKRRDLAKKGRGQLRWQRCKLSMNTTPMPLTFSLVEVKSEPAHSFRVRHFYIIGPSSCARNPASRQLARTLNERIEKGLKNRQEAALA